ncbi:MAG: hypothetical protein PHV18_00845 [Lachnospiraceae bacterium]|nr:hypothetical protein [Lachnospiraceae bacterium]
MHQQKDHQEKALDHPEAVADFFHIFTGDERFAREREKLAAEHREGSVIRMCDLFDKAEARGRSEGVEIANELNRKLAEAGRTEDIVKAAMDPAYQKKLFAEFELMKDQ